MKRMMSLILIPLVIGLIIWPVIWFRNKSKLTSEKSNALAAMSALMTACHDYYEEYQQLPLGSTTNPDGAKPTTGKGTNTIMTSLCSIISAEAESHKSINLFTYKAAKDRKDGLLRNSKTPSPKKSSKTKKSSSGPPAPTKNPAPPKQTKTTSTPGNSPLNQALPDSVVSPQPPKKLYSSPRS